MSEEYDLKKSEKGIGQLYPILEAADGEVIDGVHREEADKGWKRVRLENIDTEEKKLLARLVANFHRRVVSAEEKAEWINGLAAIYQKQGLKVGESYQSNEILKKLIDVTGLPERTVRGFLQSEFKQTALSEKHPPRLPASERIEHALSKDYVERHREEVKEELLENPEFLVEVEEKKKERIAEKAAELPEEDKEAVVKEAETFRLTEAEVAERVEEIKDARSKKMEPFPATRAVIVQGEWFVDALRNPVEKLLMLNKRGIQELDVKQRKHIEDLLIRLKIKINELLMELK